MISPPQVRDRMSWGLLFLLLFLLIAFGRITDPFPFLAPFRLAMVTGGLAAIAWFMAPGSFEDKVPLKVPQVRYVAFLMLLGIVSIAFSIWPGGSFKAVTDGLWKLVLFFLLVYYWCRTMKDARRLVWICCSGLPTLIVFSLVTGGAGTGRFESGMYDPNDLALFLVMLIPLLVFLFSTSTLVARLLILGIGLVCLSGIILSQSRGGFLALVTAVSMLLFRSKLKASLKFVIVGMICLVLATMGGDDFWGRISTIWAPSHEVDETTMATDARRETWKTSLFLIGTRPWGSGFGLCAEALAGALGEKPGKWHTAHNSYLQIGVELGVLGLVVFLRLLMKTLKDLRLVQSRSMSDRPSPEGELASMLEVSLYSFLVGGFFLSQAYAMLLYVMIALSLVLKRIVTADQAAVSAPGRIRMNPLPIRG